MEYTKTSMNISTEDFYKLNTELNDYVLMAFKDRTIMGEPGIDHFKLLIDFLGIDNSEEIYWECDFPELDLSMDEQALYLQVITYEGIQYLTDYNPMQLSWDSDLIYKLSQELNMDFLIEDNNKVVKINFIEDRS